MPRLIAPVLTATLLAVTACTSAPEEPLAPEPQPSVGVQLFQYNWDSVARECAEVLGPNHFDFVLLSPAQEHIEGEQWWTSYQPVSYQLESKLGTREQFRNMVETCHDSGIKVVADAVINHMAGIDGGVGVAGTEFSHYEYPGLYGPDDFHHCGLTPNDDIANYRDQAQVQTCELSNLADLDTAAPGVQETIAGYLNDLVSLGVDGFRIDAAKHMASEDVAAIVERIDGDPMIISEVIRGGGEPIQPEDYLDIGSVFAFGWARDFAGIVQGGSLRLAPELRDGQVPSEKAYTFVTNHDTERGEQTLNPTDGPTFQLASLLMLAVDYGTPVLYSGYAFSDRDAGAPQTDGRVDDAVCATSDEPADGEFRCLDAQQAAMAAWRAQVGDAPVANQLADGRLLAFDRGALGLAAFNADKSEEATVELTTGLPDGSYCDVLSDDCSIEVADGRVSVTVPPMGAVALHVGAMGQG
ncbi:alpha-amylase [Tessaracoccus oleiagri]|uniref:Alpha-amylase n=1 Tax=Tessaracoccus oleiagri TaxID=686624 RepID=A0A1G9H5U4_9ACTN|nr:alpha-amylase family protein [Tessaracoccus oleiagri]SDL08290.1 alpha-amylase [Tessaracoccus oleiagri]